MVTSINTVISDISRVGTEVITQIDGAFRQVGGFFRGLFG